MKKVIKFFKQINRIFMKQSVWTKTAIIMGIILVILMIINKSATYKEGFIQREKYVLKQALAYEKSILLGLLSAEVMVFTDKSKAISMSTITLLLFFYFHSL